MDEENISEEKTVEEKANVEKISCKKFWLSLLAICVAVFLAIFLAFYLTFGQMYKNMNFSYVSNDSFVNNDNLFKNIDRQVSLMNKEINSSFVPFSPNTRIFTRNTSPTVSVNEDQKNYVVKVNLAQLGKDPKNVHLNFDNNMVTISGKYENKAKNGSYNSSNFYQSFTVPTKLNPASVKREVKGDLLTITIPNK